MTKQELKDIALCGETTTVQFKQEFTGQKEIAKEMVAFANTRGGRIFFGIKDKTGELLGLSYEDIQSISRELGNTANEQVRPTIYIETEVVKADEKHFLICSIANGKNKPYKTLTGEIWVKQGADKRRVTENSEILSLFQDSETYQADAASVDNTSLADLDSYAIDDYLKRVYGKDLDGFGGNAEQVLRNIHIMSQDGKPTLAGYLFFGKHPEYNCPTCMVKAVAFYGNELGGTRYRDTKEILGNMPQVYEKSMSFLKANLHNLQEEGASFNTLGKLEIAEDILEEVVQNALIHRDLLRSAPIRIFIFDNRVEIVSPGALAGGLTIEDICNGKTYQRNPFMAVFATNALRYRGIGSGIVRILEENKNITFENDDNGREFKAIIWRKITDNKYLSGKVTDNEDLSGNVPNKISLKQAVIDKLSINEEIVDKLPVNDSTIDKMVDILCFVTNNPHCPTESIAEACSLSVENAKKYMQRLTKIDLVLSEGGNRNRTYSTKIVD